MFLKDLLPLLINHQNYIVWLRSELGSFCIYDGSTTGYRCVNQTLYDLYGSYPVESIGVVSFKLIVHICLPSLYIPLTTEYEKEDNNLEEGLFNV